MFWTINQWLVTSALIPFSHWFGKYYCNQGDLGHGKYTILTISTPPNHRFVLTDLFDIQWRTSVCAFNRTAEHTAKQHLQRKAKSKKKKTIEMSNLNKMVLERHVWQMCWVSSIVKYKAINHGWTNCWANCVLLLFCLANCQHK